MQPGEHVAIFAADAEAGLEGRRLGLELRDTILVLSHGPKLSFVFLFRKPLDGTVAEQMVKTGTGGLNVDACRIGTAAADAKAMERANTPGSGQLKAHDAGFRGAWSGSTPYDTTAGRWPPNVVLVHGLGCRMMGNRRILTGGSGVAATVHASAGYQGSSLGRDSREDGNCHRNDDGTETVAAWECSPGCPVPLLDEQSGDRPSTGPHPSSVRGESILRPGQGAYQRQGQLYADSGGASRFFPQFRDEAELRAWIERLISPIQ